MTDSEAQTGKFILDLTLVEEVEEYLRMEAAKEKAARSKK